MEPKNVWCNCVIDCAKNKPVYDKVQLELEFTPNTRICNHYHNTEIIYYPFQFVIECKKVPLIFIKHLEMTYPITVKYLKTGNTEAS